MVDYERLMKVSRSKGISWAHLSEKVGMSRYYLNNCRRSNTDIPLIKLMRIAELLGTSVEYLRGEDPLAEEELEVLLGKFLHRPECQLLFAAVEDAPPEVIRKVVKIIEILNSNDND